MRRGGSFGDQESVIGQRGKTTVKEMRIDRGIKMIDLANVGPVGEAGKQIQFETRARNALAGHEILDHRSGLGENDNQRSGAAQAQTQRPTKLRYIGTQTIMPPPPDPLP